MTLRPRGAPKPAQSSPTLIFAINDEDIDITRPSIQGLAGAGHAFAIPWSNQVRPILGGFESGLVATQNGPWAKSTPFDSPFDEKTGHDCTMIYESVGGTGMYRDAFSSRNQASTDHLSVSGSISVGYPFLSGEASAQYDKTVSDSSDAIQSSRVGSYRVGRVIVDKFPAYSVSAKQLLQTEAGRLEFRRRYGDYFVRGYALGADAGMTLSAKTESHRSEEHLKIKVTVKVLCFSASVEHSEAKSSEDLSATLHACGYSTFTGACETVDTQSMSAFDQNKVTAVAAKYMDVVAKLESNVRRRLRELKLEEGARLQPSVAFDVCRAGLVVQLLLFPHARTQGYLEASLHPRA